MNIRSLFTVLSVSIALGTSAIISRTMAAPSTKQPQATLQEEDKKPPSFLFVLQANEATISPVKSEANTYTMTMKLTDDNVKKIIEFSDRPYRIVNYMTAKQLQDLWGEGSNSFKADPPNAVLSAEGVDASIVIIQGFEVSEGQLSLTFHSTTKALLPSNLKDITLTIDSVWCRCSPPSCENCDFLGYNMS